jgi:hypothetical protein
MACMKHLLLSCLSCDGSSLQAAAAAVPLHRRQLPQQKTVAEDPPASSRPCRRLSQQNTDAEAQPQQNSDAVALLEQNIAAGALLQQQNAAAVAILQQNAAAMALLQQNAIAGAQFQTLSQVLVCFWHNEIYLLPGARQATSFVPSSETLLLLKASQALLIHTFIVSSMAATWLRCMELLLPAVAVTKAWMLVFPTDVSDLELGLLT